MQICEFEYITVDFEIAINSMNLLLNTFGSYLDNEYCEIARDNIDIFNDLRSYEFLFRQLLNNFSSLREKYQCQIELNYSNN